MPRKQTGTKAAVRPDARAPALRGGKPSPAVDPRAHGRVLAWFDDHGRHFAWRETRDPYRTMVAEVMLQQTQTGRVGPSYEDFLQRFPSLERLARAPAMDVIRAWRGLGYNRRAVELQRAAQIIDRDHGGVFPRESAALKRLPGIGEYSSNAIACFAFDVQVPVVDTNVRRVLARTALGKEADEVPLDRATALAAEWLAPGDAYRWNQALMDVGAMLCRVSKPLCAKCPLRFICSYHARGRHKQAPPRPSKDAEPFEGSRRQARGSIVDHLRRAAKKGITLAELARVMQPAGGEVGQLVEILTKLEREGLAELTPAARTGSPRGLVRLPGRSSKR